jgi:hypothetical protein
MAGCLRHEPPSGQQPYSLRRSSPGKGFAATKIPAGRILSVPAVVHSIIWRASCTPSKQRIKIMQRVTLVRYAAKPERADENERLARAVFDELKRTAPDRVAYALFRNGLDFVHLLINFDADDSSPVTELPSFKAFSKDVSARCQAPPEQTRLGVHLLDSYGLSRVKMPA